MSQEQQESKVVIALDHNTAALTNVAIGVEAVEKAEGRPGHLPGTIVFSGHSGYGKSSMAKYLVVTFKATYVELSRDWTRKFFLDTILRNQGETDYKKLTIPEKTERVCEVLGMGGRPLVLDEFDTIADREKPEEFLELIRKIIDGTHVTVMIIGEEGLPKKLAKWEKLHNRILSWNQAQPASAKDCEILAQFYYPNLTIEKGLLEDIQVKCQGITRRICINLEDVAQWALENNLSVIGREQYRKPIFTGEPPKARLL